MAKPEFLNKLQEVILEKLQEADLKEVVRFLVEEALYISIMTDLLLVSGRIRAFQEDGITRTPLGAQRVVITDMVIAIRIMSQTTIAGVSPFGWASPLLMAWEAALGDGEDVGGVVYHKALPFHMRTGMSLGLPGMLRISVQLTRQLVQLAK